MRWWRGDTGSRREHDRGSRTNALYSKPWIFLIRECNPIPSVNTLPGLGSLWKGLQSPFSQRRVEADVESLRSFYFSRGYWDSVVQVQSVKFSDNEATVSIAVESGPRYTIAAAEISGDTTRSTSLAALDLALSIPKF